jgi:hypothetical protein
MAQGNQFGGSKAALVFYEQMMRAGGKATYLQLGAIFARYGSGLNEMMKMNNPHRDLTMRWWYGEFTKEVAPFEGSVVALGVHFSFVDNLLQHRLRQSMENGAIIEKLKDRDPDWSYVVAELRKHRQWEDKQDRESP